MPTWATSLLRAGWRAAYHGISHDPEGRLRAVTLFDQAGAHLPYDDPAWSSTTESLDDSEVDTALARYGIRVTRSDPELPFATLPDIPIVADDSGD